MNWSVLCISDDPSALLLYESMLQLDGYSVFVASAADKALETSRGKSVDCVVVDHERDGTARFVGNSEAI